MEDAVHAQRMERLMSANRRRAERARLKRRWKGLDPHEARWELRALVLDPSLEVETWALEEALNSIPWIGSTKIARLLNEFGIERGTTLKHLKVRERLAIAKWLVGRRSA